MPGRLALKLTARTTIAVLLIVVSVLAVYFPVRTYELVDFDDDIYVTNNGMLRGGLSLTNLAQAFTDLHAGMWIPLTWVSYLVEADLHGLDAGAMHVTNVLVHAAGAAVLFLVLSRLTGRWLTSALLAGLFALHPLRVESVAWVTERKDVLSGLFLFLTLGAYVGYQRDRRRGRYLLCLAFYGCSLMSKPMFVTLPFLLLLLDFWPLGRLLRLSRGSVRRLLVEKVPFLAIALAVTATTLVAQVQMNALTPTNFLSPGTRVAHAIVSYVTYLKMTLWPSGLAVLYPHPETAPHPLLTLGSAALLVTATFLATRAWKSLPFLVFGWGWHLVALLPVIGLTQSGYQLIADRFTYVPSLGPLVVVTWGASALATRSRAPRALLPVVGCAVIAALSWASWRQVQYWENSNTLFAHAAETAPGNWLMHYNLGVIAGQAGKREEAIGHYRESVRLRPHFADARNNLGQVLAARGNLTEARHHYLAALQIQPTLDEARFNLALLLLRTGDRAKATEHQRILAGRGSVYAGPLLKMISSTR